MVEVDSGLAFSIVMAVLTIGMLIHLVFKQAKESVTINDYLKVYRYYILTFLVLFLLTMVPVTMYLMYRALGIENEALRTVATLAGRFGPFAVTIVLELMYWFREKK